MGQAAAKALEEYFNENVFYDDTSVSPFFILQDGRKGRLYSFSPLGKTITDESGRRSFSLVMDECEIADCQVFPTIDQAEDAFLGMATRTATARELNIFAVNAQSTIHGSYNRRGNGWIVLMHPEMFERINHDCLMPDGRTIGRWTLRAKKFDRCNHVWTSDHLDPNVIYTVWRSPDARKKLDGLVLAEGENGYAVAPYREGYILKFDYSGA